MRIRPALKGRNRFLTTNLFCPFRALLFSTPDPIPRAVPWAGMSLPLRGEIQEAQLQNSNSGSRSLKILSCVSCISWFHFLILLDRSRGGVSLSHGETGVAGDVAANEGGQHPGLDLEHPAVGHAITEDRVGHLGRLALLVGPEENLPALVVELAGVSPGQEIGRRQHAVVDQVQDHRVGDDRAELLHQVKGQRGPAVAARMIKTLILIEPDSARGREAVLAQERISKTSGSSTSQSGPQYMIQRLIRRRSLTWSRRIKVPSGWGS